MANFTSLYEENGLQGVIPYAFGMDGAGYRFLCEKLKEGADFYVIAANSTGMPFYFVDKDHVYFSAYSTKDMADRHCDKLAASKNYTSAARITADLAPVLWKRYRDLGVSHIRFDDAIWLNIRDLAPAVTYEGVLNTETPLRNPTLNAALYTFLQRCETDNCPERLIAYFWKVLQASTFYVPVRPTRTLQPGESLNSSNSDFHFEDMGGGEKAVLIFTDDEFKIIYGESFKLPVEEYKVVYLASWNDVANYIQENPGMSAVLNCCMGDMILSPENIAYFEQVSLNQAAMGRG